MHTHPLEYKKKNVSIFSYKSYKILVNKSKDLWHVIDLVWVQFMMLKHTDEPYH